MKFVLTVRLILEDFRRIFNLLHGKLAWSVSRRLGSRDSHTLQTTALNCRRWLGTYVENFTWAAFSNCCGFFNTRIPLDLTSRLSFLGFCFFLPFLKNYFMLFLFFLSLSLSFHLCLLGGSRGGGRKGRSHSSIESRLGINNVSTDFFSFTCLCEHFSVREKMYGLGQ